MVPIVTIVTILTRNPGDQNVHHPDHHDELATSHAHISGPVTSLSARLTSTEARPASFKWSIMATGVKSGYAERSPVTIST